MHKKPTYRVILAILALTFYSVQGQATAYSDKATFLNDLPGPAGILNFEYLAGGTNLSSTTQFVSGGSGTGIVFPASVVDFQGFTHNLQVVADAGNNNPTTSLLNSLGTDDSSNYNLIIAGTNIDFGLSSPVNAFGLSFITPDTLFDDDIRFSAGGEIASLVATDRTLLGNIGGIDYFTYFLGVIENNPFNSASINYGPGVSGGPFLYNVDDITVAVALAESIPEPGTVALLLSGVMAFFLRRGRRPSFAPKQVTTRV